MSEPSGIDTNQPIHMKPSEIIIIDPYQISMQSEIGTNKKQQPFNVDDEHDFGDEDIGSDVNDSNGEESIGEDEQEPI